MPYPDSLLVRGEKIIVRKRPHWKVLIIPTLFFVLIIGGGFLLAALWRNWEYASIANWVLVGIGVIALIVLVIAPFVRWRTEHFVITNHHVFFRTGLISRREHQIPLGQIANIETDVTFWGRLLGYGSLIVESSADQPLKFRNVATLPKIQSTLNQLIRDERERTHRHDGAYAEPVEDEMRPAASHPQGNPPTQSYPPQNYPPPQQSYPPPQQNYPPPQQNYPPPQGHPQQAPPGWAPPPQQQGWSQPPPGQGGQGYQAPGWTPPSHPAGSPPPSSTQPTAPRPSAAPTDAPTAGQDRS